MKLTIENSVNPLGNSDILPDINIASEFMLLINIIAISEDEKTLRSNTILNNTKFNHFLFGFGGSHMWVKQIINDEPKQQIIFVQF